MRELSYAASPKGPPTHEHDCEKCRLLGVIYGISDKLVAGHVESEIDVYQCEGGEIVLRSSSEGPDYESFPVGIARVVAANGDEKWRRAIELVDGKSPDDADQAPELAGQELSPIEALEREILALVDRHPLCDRERINALSRVITRLARED